MTSLVTGALEYTGQLGQCRSHKPPTPTHTHTPTPNTHTHTCSHSLPPSCFHPVIEPDSLQSACMCKVCVRTCVCVMQHAQTHTCFESVQDSESCVLANLTCLLKVCAHVRVYSSGQKKVSVTLPYRAVQPHGHVSALGVHVYKLKRSNYGHSGFIGVSNDYGVLILITVIQGSVPFRMPCLEAFIPSSRRRFSIAGGFNPFRK